MEPVFQHTLPYPLPSGRLPGIAPLALDEWLLADEAFAGQMALRDTLLARRRADVVQLRAAARPAAGELLALVLDLLSRRADYRREAGAMRRPDGKRVRLDAGDPLGTLGHLVQEDFCLLIRHPGRREHVLEGAVLCFPAGWTLAEKLGHPLGRIHAPVASYDPEMGRRVQRLFDALRPEQPLWRANALPYQHAELFAPASEAAPRPGAGPDAPWLRSERQCLLRLPNSGAVVFSIHTYLLRNGGDGARKRGDGG